MRTGNRRALRLAAALTVAGVFLAACSDTPTGSGAGSTSIAAPSASSVATASGAAAGDAVASLPADLQGAYAGLDQPVGKTPLESFMAKKPKPWTIGYASSYDGNTWRAEAMNRIMKDLLPKYQQAGIVKDVVVTQSNLVDATQIQQIRQLADQGVDAIIICCSSISALNEAVKYAYDKGVPTFTWSGYLTSPYSLNVSANYRQAGRDAAKWLADKIGGKGNVLNVVGIPGAASSDTYDAGVKEGLKAYPNIKIVGDVAGKWTDPIAKAEVLKFLATHPGKIDGVITQSAQETGVLQAFLSSGRDVPPMTLGGEAGAACYWRKNPSWVDKGFHVWPPGDEMQFAFEAAVRTLEGQGPKIASLIRTSAEFSIDDVNKALPADCDVNGQGWLQPGPDEWMPSSTLDKFFDKPADPLKG